MDNKNVVEPDVRAVATEGEGHEKTEQEKAEPNGSQEEIKDNGKKKKEPGNLAYFFRILSYGDKLDCTLMLICTITALGAGIAMPLMFLVFGRLVGDFTGYFSPMPTTTKERFMHAVNQNALYMVYLGIARVILSYVSMLSIRTSGLRISARIRLAYLRALFLQPVSSMDMTSASPGVIATRLTTNSNIIELGISQQFSLAIQAITFTLGLYIVSFTKSGTLTLVASAPLPIVLIAYGFALPFIQKYYLQGEGIKEQASSLAFEIFESIRIVVAFGAEDRLTARHRRILQEARQYERKSAPFIGLLLAPMFIAVYATFALTFWFGIRQYTRGKIPGIQTIVVVLFCVLWAVMCISRLYSPIIQIGKAAAASIDIFAVLDAKGPDITGLKDPDVQIDDIVFRDVTFAYPSRPDVTILDGLNLRFEKGKTTAIVGPSGSGKSTIISLLERWYEPAGTVTRTPSSEDVFAREVEIFEKTEKMVTPWPADTRVNSGIFIGGTNLKDVDVKWWRSHVGLVQQEPFLFNDTIFNNVAYGLAGTKWEKAPLENKVNMVQNACREAFAEEFITRLPLGYETIVGESGMKLSGGQRQRIAIARAIVKEPEVLILDEATSAIDVRTEKIVQAALDRVSNNRTTIAIAHRLSTIIKADQIVVIRAGKLAEEGTHKELMQHDGVYAGFVRAQAVELGQEDVDSIENIQDYDTIDTKGETTNHAATQAGEAPEPEYKQRAFLSSFGLLVFEQRSRWILYTLTVLGAMGGGATYPIQAYLFAKCVNVFTLYKDELIRRGNFWALMFLVQAGGVGVAYMVLGWSASLISTAVASYYRQEYFEDIVNKRISFFDKEGNSPGTLTARLSTDSSQLQQLLGSEMGMSLIAILSIIGSIIISFVFGWKLALVGVLTIMPVTLTMGYFRVHLEASFERLNAIVFAESSQFGSEAIGAFRTVTALTMEDTITNRFDNLLQTHVASALHKARYSTLVFAFSDSADMFCQALAFWYGGRLLANREYTITQFFVIYMAVVMSSLAAGMWFSFSPNIVEATAAANRIISVRSTATKKVLRPLPPGKGPAAVEFQNVHFTYKDRDVPVLAGVNIKIKHGQFAAFVGASGSGKSTMISLLERFYDPTVGRILLDDMDITEVDPKSYRKHLSLVAQESTLYAGTIRENISLSVEEAEATDDAIQEACRSAQIHDFISSLPDGYATRIGPKGFALSGGQRQRIALARALLRRPQLLLLDEATSNLDSESEKLVQEAIERAATSGLTIISVAHRLATIQNADVIFVLGSGRVLETGNHAQLLAHRGVYYQMCQAQALDR